MQKTIHLIFNDIRLIFRDKTLFTFLFVPVLIILFIRYFVPYITAQYPIVADYHHIIMMFGGIQTAVMFGFITSFIILDEKDENVLQVIRTLPLSSFHFIVYRLLFATTFSSLGAFLMLNFCGIAYPGFTNSILLSTQYGLIAPFISLVVATFAKNKVEGMAYFKGVDLVLLLPILSFFFPGISDYILAIIPTYWTYHLYDASWRGVTNIPLFLLGTGIYLLVISILFTQFKSRVFDR